MLMLIKTHGEQMVLRHEWIRFRRSWASHVCMENWMRAEAVICRGEQVGNGSDEVQ